MWSRRNTAPAGPLKEIYPRVWDVTRKCFRLASDHLLHNSLLGRKLNIPRVSMDPNPGLGGHLIMVSDTLKLSRDIQQCKLISDPEHCVFPYY